MKDDYLKLRAESFTRSYRKPLYVVEGDEYDTHPLTTYFIAQDNKGRVLGGMRATRSPRGSDTKLRYEKKIPGHRVSDYLSVPVDPVELDYYELGSLAAVQGRNMGSRIMDAGFDYVRANFDSDVGIGYVMPVNVRAAAQSALRCNMSAVMCRESLLVGNIPHLITLIFPDESSEAMTTLLAQGRAMRMEDFVESYEKTKIHSTLEM